MKKWDGECYHRWPPVVNGAAKCDGLCMCVHRLMRGVPVEPIHIHRSVPGAWKQYTGLHNWTSTCFKHLHMGHPSSLIQPCSDNLTSMATISFNSLLITLIIVNVEQYLLRPKQKRHHKVPFILFIIYVRTFWREENKTIFSFNLVRSVGCYSPWCSILSSLHGITLGFYNWDSHCQS